MPKRYVAIRNALAAKMSYDEAQERAAKIYNATRKRNEPKLSNKKHHK